MLGKVTSTGLYADIGNIPSIYFVKKHKNWYRSSEIVAGNVDTGYGVHLINKKWPLKKKYNLNILRFTHAGLLLISKQFTQFVWEEELQILGMPHFYLAFILLGIGSVISIIMFIFEKYVINKKNN